MFALIWGLTFTQLAIYTIGFAAIIAIVVIILRHLNMIPPEWFKQICWIIVLAFVGIVAVLIVASMMGTA